MVKNITDAAIRQMREELEQFEARGRRELRDQRTHAVGLLRIDLVEQCHRRLSFIEATMWKAPVICETTQSVSNNDSGADRELTGQRALFERKGAP
jgi:hypothetical protein